MTQINRTRKFFSGLLSDKGLTKKAYLNLLTVVLDYGASLIVGFIITPLMVRGLGNFIFGMWQVLVRLIGYLTPASGRAAFALKATIANQQASTDYDQKRRYIGSTLLIWLLFLPILVGIGGAVSWFVPYWIKAPVAYFWVARAVSGLLVLGMIFSTTTSVPEVTLQGENFGYKRMGMSVVLIFMGGGFTWLALFLRTGIVGVAAALIVTDIVTGLFYLVVVRKNVPWFGVARPRRTDTRRMLGLSWWFICWNLVTSLLLGSDVVVLGLLNSVESVTNYSLTKYVPDFSIGVIVIIIFGIAPGLGSIIGTGDFEKVVRVRAELFSSIWLVATTLGASIIVWNRVFLGLWVGPSHYSGSIPNLLLVVSAIQLAFIRSDGNIIDLTLRLSQKVILGLISVTISIVAASIMVGIFKLGIIGLCFGIMGGRLIMSIGYPMLIGRFFGVPIYSQMNAILRPVFVTILIFSIAIGLERYVLFTVGVGIKGWLIFIISAGATGIAMLLISFYAGLSGDQRMNMIRRVQALVTSAESS
jgi:O-antigen/teichoic acid export membrane protein